MEKSAIIEEVVTIIHLQMFSVIFVDPDGEMINRQALTAVPRKDELVTVDALDDYHLIKSMSAERPNFRIEGLVDTVEWEFDGSASMVYVHLKNTRAL